MLMILCVAWLLQSIALIAIVLAYVDLVRRWDLSQSEVEYYKARLAQSRKERGLGVNLNNKP